MTEEESSRSPPYVLQQSVALSKDQEPENSFASPQITEGALPHRSALGFPGLAGGVTFTIYGESRCTVDPELSTSVMGALAPVSRVPVVLGPRHALGLFGVFGAVSFQAKLDSSSHPGQTNEPVWNLFYFIVLADFS